MIRFWRRRRRRRWVSKNLEILVKKRKWVGTKFGRFGEEEEDGCERIWKF
jgi:hypothetical protein